MKEKNRNIVLCDIDGCITDYPHIFLDWVNKRFDKSFASIDEIVGDVGKDIYEIYKYLYRKSSYKSSIEIQSNIKDILEMLSKERVLIFMTTRPSFHENIKTTLYWLDAIGYHSIIFTNDKMSIINSMSNYIALVIDDDARICNKCSEYDFKCLHIRNSNDWDTIWEMI